MSSSVSAESPAQPTGKITYSAKKFDFVLESDGKTLSRTPASDRDRRFLVIRQDVAPRKNGGELKISLDMRNAIEDLAVVYFRDIAYACAVNAPQGKLSLIRAADECLQRCLYEGCQKGEDQCLSRRRTVDTRLQHPLAVTGNQKCELLAIAGGSEKKVSFINTRVQNVDADPIVKDVGCSPTVIQFSPDGTRVFAAAPEDNAIVMLTLPQPPLRDSGSSHDITQTPIRLVPDTGFMGPSWLSVNEVSEQDEKGNEGLTKKKYMVTALCPNAGYTKAQAFTVLITPGAQEKPDVKKSGDAANPAVEADLTPFVSSQVTAHCVELQP
ncbi:hypothetical protein [Streptomyces noursei]|uniref:hypothetical protein n=1 Tax=Streptomyces noursei TaxID=1971 RepID=UPI0011AEEDFB|nr:hypothetical protein [Streptomyces noursei]